ncbi:MAG: DUF3592 domain-containing protein [Burkholderiales bacterium]
MADPVLCWAFVGVGAFGQGVALLLARRPLRLLRAGGKAQATVVGNDEQMLASKSGPSRTFYFPKLAFTTGRGERISFTSASGSLVPYPEKSELPVIYDPATPHEAQPATFRSMWLFPLAASLFSLPFLLAGWLAMP